jgi:hypothetical protein
MVRLILVLVLAAAGCSASAPPASSSSDRDVDAACANLARIGCPEGLDPTCAATIRRASRVLDVRAPCLAIATTPEAARACGSVTCQE